MPLTPLSRCHLRNEKLSRPETRSALISHLTTLPDNKRVCCLGGWHSEKGDVSGEGPACFCRVYVIDSNTKAKAKEPGKIKKLTIIRLDIPCYSKKFTSA